MKRQTLIALGAALFLGLIAVFLANSFLMGAQQRAELSGSTKVAVAAVPLEYGVEITPDKIRMVDFPNASIPPGSFHSLAEILPAGKKRVALLPIQLSEPILSSKVSGEGQNASIAALLPDGKRAAAVRVNDVSGVAGFIQPNDSVDVLVTRQVGGQANSQQVTDVLLQNARIIAIDQDAKGEDGKPTLAKTATLQVDPLDAQKLALAQQIGSLSLVLRKPGDDQNNPMVETVSLADLRYNLYGGVHRPVDPAPAVVHRAPRVTAHRIAAPLARMPAPPPIPQGTSVQVVRGTQDNVYQVGNHGS